MGISPFTGLHGISYAMFKPVNIELRAWVRWSNDRTRLSLAENNSGVISTDSWYTINAGLVYYMNDDTKIYLTGENLTDKHYTVYRLLDSRNRDNYLWASGIGISIGFECSF